MKYFLFIIVHDIYLFNKIFLLSAIPSAIGQIPSIHGSKQNCCNYHNSQHRITWVSKYETEHHNLQGQTPLLALLGKGIHFINDRLQHFHMSLNSRSVFTFNNRLHYETIIVAKPKTTDYNSVNTTQTKNVGLHIYSSASLGRRKPCMLTRRVSAYAYHSHIPQVCRGYRIPSPHTPGYRCSIPVAATLYLAIDMQI